MKGLERVILAGRSRVWQYHMQFNVVLWLRPYDGKVVLISSNNPSIDLASTEAGLSPVVIILILPSSLTIIAADLSPKVIEEPPLVLIELREGEGGEVFSLG